MSSLLVRPVNAGLLSLDEMLKQFDGVSLLAPDLFPGEVATYNFGSDWNESDYNVTVFGNQVVSASADASHAENETGVLQHDSIFKAASSTDAESGSTQVNMTEFGFHYGYGHYAVVTENYMLVENFDNKGNPDYIYRDLSLSHDGGVWTTFQIDGPYSLSGSSSKYDHFGSGQTNIAWNGGAYEQDRADASTSNWNSMSGQNFAMGSGEYAADSLTHTKMAYVDGNGHETYALDDVRTTDDNGASSWSQFGDTSSNWWQNHHVETDTMQSGGEGWNFTRGYQMITSSGGNGVSGPGFDMNSFRFAGEEHTQMKDVNYDASGAVKFASSDVIDHYFGGSNDAFNFKTIDGASSTRFDQTIERIDTWSAGGNASHTVLTSFMTSFDSSVNAPGMVATHHEDARASSENTITLVGQSNGNLALDQWHLG